MTKVIYTLHKQFTKNSLAGSSTPDLNHWNGDMYKHARAHTHTHPHTHTHSGVPNRWATCNVLMKKTKQRGRDTYYIDTVSTASNETRTHTRDNSTT